MTKGYCRQRPGDCTKGSTGSKRTIKLTSRKDIDEAALTDFVRQAVALNLKEGDPTNGR